MASHLMSPFFAFSIFFISTYGRELQRNYTSEIIANIKVKAVSRAINSYTGQTNYDDVQGLVAIGNMYPTLIENNEDPCLPPKWSWIVCNFDAKPRIIALDLNNKLLIGLVPDFSSMDALQTVDLSQNSFVGLIPSFFGSFPDLQELNLANNLFYGLIPDSIACNKKLKLNVVGNAGLYISNSCSSTTNKASPVDTTTTTTTYVYQPTSVRRKSKLPVILGSSLSLLFIFSVIVGIFAIFRHKAKTAAAIAATSAPPPER